MRPPPVHLPAGHCGGGPAQKFGLPLTEVDGVESWHAIVNSAAAAKPCPKRSIVCVSMLRRLAGSSTRDCYVDAPGKTCASRAASEGCCGTGSCVGVSP